MADRAPKTRVTIRLTSDTAQLLSNASGGKYGLVSDIADQAIKAWFQPEHDASFKLMARRLDQMQKHMQRLAEDQIVVMQAVNTFVWFYLLTSPSVANPDRPEHKAVALKRYQDFLRRLGKDVRSDTHLSDLVLEEDAAGVEADHLSDLSVDPVSELEGSAV